MLAHVFPGADVPVVLLSLNATKDDAYHLELARCARAASSSSAAATRPTSERRSQR